MADLTRRQLALCAAAVVLAVLLGLHQLGRGAPDTAAAPRAAPIRLGGDGGSGGRVIVHVAGAVARPGVYKLPAGSRADDAVQRAGGATRRAELGGLNLAAKLEDGRQVLVPERPRPGRAVAASASAGAAPADGQPLNLNTATFEQLDTLDGVGPATAQKILDFREQHGGFGSVEDLGQIPGIGEKRLAALREKVTV
jgi:competence protein ComEA